MKPELEQIAASYSRLSYDIGGRINFAYDLRSDTALAAAEREKEHLDQAFFVLCFAALEKQVLMLATAKLNEPRRRRSMRDAKFEKRLETAIKVASESGATSVWSGAETQIKIWYNIRNEIAHGDPPSRLLDIPAVLKQADAVATILDKVSKALTTASKKS